MSEQTHSELGNYLRLRREELKLDIKDIANRTAIRTYILEMLEKGEFEALPSYVHAHGFLAQYSKTLGLDFENDIKPRFDSECRKDTFGLGQIDDTEKSETLNQSDFEARTGNLKNIIIAVGIIALAGVIYLIFTTMKSTETEPVPTATYGVSSQSVDDTVLYTPQPDYLDEQANSAEATEPEPLEPALQTVVLSYNGDCWTNYESDDGTTGDFIAIRGSERSITFYNYFRLHLGNASALVIKYNDQEITSFGSDSQSLRNLYFVRNDEGGLTLTRTAPVAQQ